MRIQYLGHSAFRLLSDGFSHSIICDPYDESLVGEKMPCLSADLITLSHQHADHNYVDGVLGDAPIADCVGEGAFDDISVCAFETNHDSVNGKKRGKNLVFVFNIDGIKVAHLGDLGEVKQEIVEKLQGVDVLLIPVGGNYTIDAFQAKWYCDQIQPRIVIPMHFKRGDVTIDIAPVEDFCDLFPPSLVENVGETLHLDFFDEDDYMKVVVMEKMED
ncbi:MAG: MBL fold metallo-hydrolase [Clostridia bacterium]|nr:MBL fold metallo-hydrolase [Clostridia bacterium]